jgi:hypothetical protein
MMAAHAAMARPASTKYWGMARTTCTEAATARGVGFGAVVLGGQVEVERGIVLVHEEVDLILDGLERTRDTAQPVRAVGM